MNFEIAKRVQELNLRTPEHKLRHPTKGKTI